jgi:hypothetical protein
MGFLTPATDFRFLKASETTANAPLSEELLSQIRQNLEELYRYTRYAGIDGTLTSDPTETLLTDTGAVGWVASALVGLTAVITSGNAQGYTAVITANTTTTITCSAATFSTFGVASGNTIEIYYTRNDTTGHTHDGIDSSAGLSFFSRVYDKSTGGTACTGTTRFNSTDWDTSGWLVTKRASHTKMIASMFATGGVGVPRIYIFTSYPTGYNFPMDSAFDPSQAMPASSANALSITGWGTDIYLGFTRIRIGNPSATSTVYNLQLFLC